LRSDDYQNYSFNEANVYLNVFFSIDDGLANFGVFSSAGGVFEASVNKSAIDLNGKFKAANLNAKFKAQNSMTFAALLSGGAFYDQGNDVVVSNCDYVVNSATTNNAYFVLQSGNLLGTPDIGANENDAGNAYNLNADRNYYVIIEDLETITRGTE
jgi:hypothetical protein